MTAAIQSSPSASAIPDTDPFALFDAWLAQAEGTEPNDPNAMALATATPDGMPSVRMVLLKGHGPDLVPGGGFTFYTNTQSRKGGELRANMQAALLFHWKTQTRQIRIEGALQEVSPEIADDYFHSRSRQSQLGAVASDQSRPLANRQTFLDRIRRGGAALRRGASGTARALDRLYPDPARFRILDGPPRPPARSPPVRTAGRRVGGYAVVSVTP